MATAALIVDVQVGLVAGAHNEAEVLANIARTVSAIRSRAGTVVYIQHCHASYEPLQKPNPGWQLHPALDARSTDSYVEKTASDAFYQTNLNQLLKGLGVTDLYIAGLQTEYCVDATCRVAQSLGYQVHLVQDAHTTGDTDLPAQSVIDHHNTVLQNLAHPDRPIKLVTAEQL